MRVGCSIVGWIGALSLASPAIAGGFDRAIEAASARVVKIYGLGAGLQAGYGSGILVSEDGLVLTVSSLMIDARTILVVDAPGRRFEAEVLHRDMDRQLAVLKIRRFEGQTDHSSSDEESAIGPFPYFDLRCNGEDGACHSPLLPGDWVVAAGNAFKVATGPEPVSIAHGVFSTRVRLDARRRLRDFPYTGDVLVIDAITSNPGAAGSALVNLDGELVGMIGRDVQSNRTHTHLNYAVPREVLWAYFQEATGLRDAEEDEKQAVWTSERLGLRISRTGYRKVLPFVEHVQRESPADQAGVRRDDLLLSLNGYNLTDADTFDQRLQTIPATETVELVLRRGRNIQTVRVEGEGS